MPSNFKVDIELTWNQHWNTLNTGVMLEVSPRCEFEVRKLGRMGEKGMESLRRVHDP